MPNRIIESLNFERVGRRDALAQRLYGMCCGEEDLNDHGTLNSECSQHTVESRMRVI